MGAIHRDNESKVADSILPFVMLGLFVAVVASFGGGSGVVGGGACCNGQQFFFMLHPSRVS